MHRGARPYSSTSRKCKALWNILSQSGLRSNVIGWWAISDEDFAMYKEVVKSAYRFHEMMLERLLDLAGPETTVIFCSDHGFESGSQRPRGTPREPAGPAAWHRQYGIFVMAGPGIRRDERIYGLSLIDLAPTVLTLFDPGRAGHGWPAPA